MKKAITLLAVAATVLVSCQKEQAPSYDNENIKINGSILTFKTSAEASGVFWKSGDEISVVCDAETYAFTTDGSGETAKFTTKETLTPTKIGSNPLTGYYGCNSFGNFTIAQNQTIVSGVSQTKLPMYAYTTASPEKAEVSMSFTPAASMVEILLSDCDITANSIELVPVDETQVIGNVCGSYTVNPVTGKVKATGDIKSVKVNFQGGASLKSGLSVKFPVGWFSITGGMKLILTYNNASTYEELLWSKETFASYRGDATAPQYKYIQVPVEVVIGPRNYYVTAAGEATSKGLSWDAPTTLEYALTSAESGSTIHIGAGSYKPGKALAGYEGTDVKYNTFEIAHNVKLIGGYPEKPESGAESDPSKNVTILNGNGAYHTVCVTAVPVTGEAVSINGLTITGGDGSTAEKDVTVTSTVNGKEYADVYAAGIYAISTTIELNNCIIKENKGKNAAGAFFNGCTVQLKNVTSTKNDGAGNGTGLWCSNCVADIQDCCFTENTSTGVGAGLYLYAAAEGTAVSSVKNVEISKNTTTNNYAALYVRGDAKATKSEAVLENLTIKENSANMAAGFGVTYANADFKNCTIINNTSTGNGSNHVYTGATVTMDKCLVSGNNALTASAVYVYTDADACSLSASNCEFSKNETTGRGGAIYARAAAANVKLNVANSTFFGNKAGSYGSAIAFNATAAFPVVANIFSSTFTGNVSTNNKNAVYGGALGFETVGITCNIYNSIISGNTFNFAPANADISCSNAGEGSYKMNKSIVGTVTYDAASAAVSEAPAFDPATMLSAVTKSSPFTQVYKLSGSNNPATTYGMPVNDLKTAGAAFFSADVLGADQCGNSRSASAMGSYVGQ